MEIKITATGTIDTINGGIPARIWEGHTAAGVPVKAWISVVQPQSDDESVLAAFAAELREVPAVRELVSFDLRMAL